MDRLEWHGQRVLQFRQDIGIRIPGYGQRNVFRL